jgi:hypothetical protein
MYIAYIFVCLSISLGSFGAVVMLFLYSEYEYMIDEKALCITVCICMLLPLQSKSIEEELIVLVFASYS